jgi:hypothetical protein
MPGVPHSSKESHCRRLAQLRVRFCLFTTLSCLTKTDRLMKHKSEVFTDGEVLFTSRQYQQADSIPYSQRQRVNTNVN